MSHTWKRPCHATFVQRQNGQDRKCSAHALIIACNRNTQAHTCKEREQKARYTHMQLKAGWIGYNKNRFSSKSDVTHPEPLAASTVQFLLPPPSSPLLKNLQLTTDSVRVVIQQLVHPPQLKMIRSESSPFIEHRPGAWRLCGFW